jgi:hypothetical protein
MFCFRTAESSDSMDMTAQMMGFSHPPGTMHEIRRAWRCVIITRKFCDLVHFPRFLILSGPSRDNFWFLNTFNPLPNILPWSIFGFWQRPSSAMYFILRPAIAMFTLGRTPLQHAWPARVAHVQSRFVETSSDIDHLKLHLQSIPLSPRVMYKRIQLPHLKNPQPRLSA